MPSNDPSLAVMNELVPMLNRFQRTEVALGADNRGRDGRTHDRKAPDPYQHEHENRHSADDTTAAAPTLAGPAPLATTTRHDRPQIDIPVAATRHTTMLPTATAPNR